MTTKSVNRRLELQFSSLDSDGDGRIDLDDYLRQATEIYQAYNKSPESREAKDLVSAYRKTWDRLSQSMDLDSDRLVAKEEFLANFDKVIDKAGPEVFKPITEATFRILDTDNTGTVSLSEFTKAASILGVPKNEVEPAFRRHDSDNDGALSLEETHRFVSEYYRG